MAERAEEAVEAAVAALQEERLGPVKVVRTPWAQVAAAGKLWLSS